MAFASISHSLSVPCVYHSFSPLKLGFFFLGGGGSGKRGSVSLILLEQPTFYREKPLASRPRDADLSISTVRNSGSVAAAKAEQGKIRSRFCRQNVLKVLPGKTDEKISH